MIPRPYLLAVSALVVLQLPAFSKNEHAHAGLHLHANADVKAGTKKTAVHKSDALPIAVQRSHDSNTSAPDMKDAADAPAQVLEPDGNEDPHAPPGALYTDSDDTG